MFMFRLGVVAGSCGVVAMAVAAPIGRRFVGAGRPMGVRPIVRVATDPLAVAAIVAALGVLAVRFGW